MRDQITKTRAEREKKDSNIKWPPQVLKRAHVSLRDK